MWRISADCLCRGTEEVKLKSGESVELWPRTILTAIEIPGHQGHLMFKADNNLFTGVADYREEGIRKVARGCNLYPGMGPVLEIFNERG